MTDVEKREKEADLERRFALAHTAGVISGLLQWNPDDPAVIMRLLQAEHLRIESAYARARAIEGGCGI